MNVDNKLLKKQIRLIEERALPKSSVGEWDEDDDAVGGLIDFLWEIQSTLEEQGEIRLEDYKLLY